MVPEPQFDWLLPSRRLWEDGRRLWGSAVIATRITVNTRDVRKRFVRFLLEQWNGAEYLISDQIYSGQY